MQRDRLTAPWYSITFRLPARTWRPSTFCVMRVKLRPGPRLASKAARASWAALGLASPQMRREAAQNRQTAAGSDSSVERHDSRTRVSSFHSPSGPRKGLIPEATEIPAPVSTTMFLKLPISKASITAPFYGKRIQAGGRMVNAGATRQRRRQKEPSRKNWTDSSATTRGDALFELISLKLLYLLLDRRFFVLVRLFRKLIVELGETLVDVTSKP